MSKAVPWTDEYALPAVVTFASMFQQTQFARKVGMARMKYNVPPPETTGDPAFVRTYRAQQNCVEFFPLSMGSLWLASLYTSPVAASAVGAIYMYGRHKYVKDYSESADKRMVGFIISMQSLMALLLMGGAGVTTAVLRRYADIDLAVLASDLFNKVFNRQ